MANLFSMTGYGRGQSTGPVGKALVEIKAVNHRSLKCSYRLPTGWNSLETVLRPAIENGLERGALEIFVQITPTSTVPGEPPPGDLIDMDRLNAYVKASRLAAAQTGLAEPDSITPFLSMPGMVREITIDPDLDAWRPILLDAADKARQSLNQQRAHEGAALSTFFHATLNTMTVALEKIRTRAPLRLAEYLEQYRKRIQALLDQATPGVALNREILERETVLAADRLTIDEEITRLAHHIQSFGRELASGGPTGKTLEFITQEMLREANTIGSKSLDSALTDLVVLMKSEIEKLKEQVANVV